MVKLKTDHLSAMIVFRPTNLLRPLKSPKPIHYLHMVRTTKTETMLWTTYYYSAPQVVAISKKIEKRKGGDLADTFLDDLIIFEKASREAPQK